MVTIMDVARLAGVSPSTVSHVLNGKRPISESTKQRVHQSIRELGYEPNPNAQALRGSAAGIIGFLASDITEFFSTLIIQGVEKVSISRNAYILFTSGVEFNNDLDAALAFLKKRRIDGLILSYGIRRKLTFEGAAHLKIPVVTINTHLGKGIPSVEPDDYLAGCEAAKRLLERGVKKPCLIAGPKDRLASEDRMEGFIHTLKMEGHTFDPETRLVHGDFSVGSGKEGFLTLLERTRDMDGLFCANDFMAAGAIKAATDLKITIPDQLKIIGFDNREFGNFWSIPISTFALPLFEMGRRSTEILFDMMSGIKSTETQYLLPSQYIGRSSC